MSSNDTHPLSALVREELGELTPYRIHEGAADGGTTKLDANESPWALEPETAARIGREVERLALNRYPDPSATRLRSALAAHVGVSADELVIGAGSDESISMMMNALRRPRPGRARASVLFPSPSFVMFPLSARVFGLDAIAVPLDERWDLDVAAMRAAIEEHRPNLVFLPTPNNPTGGLFSDDRLRAVLDAAPDAMVIIDEAYGAFANRSYLAWRDRYPQLGILQTLSKIGLASIRCGWAILPEPIAREVDKCRSPYNLAGPTQRIAELAVTELRDELARAASRVVEERERLRRALGALGLVVAPSAANFLWVDAGDRGAAEVYRALAARGVHVRSFAGATGRVARHLRVTVGTPGENELLLDALRASIG